MSEGERKKFSPVGENLNQKSDNNNNNKNSYVDEEERTTYESDKKISSTDNNGSGVDVEKREIERGPGGQPEEITDRHKEELNEPEKLREMLQEKEKEMEELWQRYLWLQADFDNFRKRSYKEREDAVRSSMVDFMAELLKVVDNFERALETEQCEVDGLLSGVNMIYRQFKELLHKEGLEEIPAEGETFNPEKHHAVMQEESELEEGTVIEVLQKGYCWKGKVIRPAMVKVAK